MPFVCSYRRECIFRDDSLGLPRVYKQNSKLVFLQKCQTTVYRNILPVYGTLNEKSAIKGILKAQQTKREIPILSRNISFWQKYDVACHVAFQNCQQMVYRVFFASLRYVRQFTVHWTKISYWGYSKTRRGIPIPFTVTVDLFLAKHTMLFFVLSWF